MSDITNTGNAISLAAPQKRAQDFLELVQRSKRGRLKLYVGFAAGVGKTYRMLEEAHALSKRGTDIVIGYVETHDRAETAALLDGLEVVPRKQIVYRGLTVEEMDLDGVLRDILRSRLSTSCLTRMCPAPSTPNATKTCWSCWTRESTSSVPLMCSI